jgi:hypothetical protein
MRTAVPKRPVIRESRKPGRVRSRRYQRKGFTRARVRESWRVEDQGSLRWGGLALSYEVLVG